MSPPVPLAEMLMHSVDQRNIKQEILYGDNNNNNNNAYPQHIQQQQLDAALAAKNELIRLLLEMSPQEVLRE